MAKKVVYTQITPIPKHIPRQLALDILHSHGEIIELNPLVIEHHPIKAPQNAAADEYFSVWHEITERIQYVPGMGRMGSGKISFKAVFHDMPWGLQTHVYAPAGVDTRNKWQVRGNEPGEPAEPRELGSNAPADGLYLREDVEIRCNITMVPFVKNQNKKASAIFVERLVRKAELLDSGVLHAMFENGKLKSVNPAVRDSMGMGAVYPPQASPRLPSQFSPPQASQSSSMSSPQTRSDTSPIEQLGSSHQDNRAAPYHILRQKQQEQDRKRQSVMSDHSQFQNGNSPYNQQRQWQQQQQQLNPYARQSSYSQSDNSGLAIEMPADAYYPPQHQHHPPSHLHPQQQNQNRYSHYSELSGASPIQTSFNSTGAGMGSDRLSSRASTGSRPSDQASQSYGDGGMQSPGVKQPYEAPGPRSYATELPTR